MYRIDWSTDVPINNRQPITEYWEEQMENFGKFEKFPGDKKSEASFGEFKIEKET